MTLWQVHHFRASERSLYTCGGIFPYDITVGGLTNPALDNSGQFILAGAFDYAPRISLNGGIDWSVVDPWPGYAGFHNFDCNLDGTHLIACENPGRLQVSWDQGATWPYGQQAVNHVWGDVRVSANGDVCLAYDDFNNFYNSGRFYISMDGGVVWTVPRIGVTSPNNDPYTHQYYGIACSSDGAKMAIIRDQPNFTVDLWISNNYGADYSWVKTSPSGVFNTKWNDVDMDSDGSVIVVCKGTAFYSYADAGSIWISKDGGGTWAQKYPLNDGLGHSWQTVCCSEDGSVILAKKRNSQYYDSLWYSWNTGTDWREILPASAGNLTWGKPKVSGGGSIMAIVDISPPYDMYVCQLATL